MRRLPHLSAALFGLAALLFSVALLFPDRHVLPLDWRILGLFAVLPATLWGYLSGRYLRPEAQKANRAHFGLVGAVTTMAAAATGALAIAAAVVYAAAAAPPEPLHHTVDAVLAVLGYGVVFGFIAMPLGIGAGLVLRALARRMQPPPV